LPYTPPDMALKRPKGTFDLLPPGSPGLEKHNAMSRHVQVLERARQILERAGAKFIQTPLFEALELVERGVGETTDVVQKEMYSVSSRGSGESFVLRPEGTASIVRAYFENGLKQFPAPLKLWTYGPMFRAERPQEGRYRQFHQVDYEVLGSGDPLTDAEAIALMWTVLERIGLKNLELKVGSLGDPADRAAYNAYLREVFTPHLERLSPLSRNRLERNPLRILDSKELQDIALIAELSPKSLLESLGADARAHLDRVCAYLTAWSVPYALDPGIVRGLDYYRRTAWEVHHRGVGAKAALGGGGRYDGLAELLGGPPTPGVGWALGLERILIALEAEGVPAPAVAGPLVYLGALEEGLLKHVTGLALELRRFASCEFGYRAKKPGKHLEDAVKKGAVFLGLIGPDEASAGTISLKNLENSEQRVLARADLNRYLQTYTSIES